MEIETKNAIIKSAEITSANYGCLSAYLQLDYDGTGQSFGGYSLYLPKGGLDAKNVAGHFIWRVLEIAGVKEWDNLVGKTIRVRATNNKVLSIGHIVKDKWFTPSEEFGD